MANRNPCDGANFQRACQVRRIMASLSPDPEFSDVTEQCGGHRQDRSCSQHLADAF